MNSLTIENLVRRREWVAVIAATVGVTLFAHLLFSRFFPGPNGVGHDYSGGLTQFLAEYYWSLSEGPLVPPWFTPAFCGGIPLFADPVNQFFSVAGFLMRFAEIDPLTGSYITFLAAVSVGFLGSYLLVRRRLNGSIAAALLAGVLFGLNGFLSSRMLIGHTIYHGVALIPFVALWLTEKDRIKLSIHRRVIAISLISLSVTYWLYSGGGVLIVPFALATVPLVVLSWLRGGELRETLLRATASFLIILALSAAKLNAIFAYMQAFPRSGYSLPGYISILDTLKVLFLSLFTNAPDIAQFSQQRLTNGQWFQDRHELEYGVTIIPIVLIGLVALARLFRPEKGDTQSAVEHWLPAPSRLFAYGLLTLTMMIPIALNTYGEAWNAFLKSLPLIGSSSSLLRWFVIYVPVVAVVGGLAIDRLRESDRQRMTLCALCIIGVMVILSSVDRRFYEQQSYDPKPMLTAFKEVVRDPSSRPPIRAVGAFVDQQGNVQLTMNRQDLMFQGISQLACYVPIFGYRLEFFPFRSLRPGSIYETSADGFNMKNPACFVFPEENGCSIGDHFPVTRRADLERFADYASFPFVKSDRQAIADSLSIGSFAIVMLILGWASVRVLSERYRIK